MRPGADGRGPSGTRCQGRPCSVPAHVACPKTVRYRAGWWCCGPRRSFHWSAGVTRKAFFSCAKVASDALRHRVKSRRRAAVARSLPMSPPQESSESRVLPGPRRGSRCGGVPRRIDVPSGVARCGGSSAPPAGSSKAVGFWPVGVSRVSRESAEPFRSVGGVVDCRGGRCVASLRHWCPRRAPSRL